MSKHLIVHTGLGGSLLLLCAVFGLAKCDGNDVNNVDDVKTVQSNHSELHYLEPDDIDTSANPPFSKWNNIASETENHINCGSYKLTVTDVETATWNKTENKNDNTEYAFLKVVSNGFTVAEVTSWDFEDSSDVDFRINNEGRYSNRISATAKDDNGNKVDFNLFATGDSKEPNRADTDFTLVTESDAKGVKPAITQCQFYDSKVIK